MRKGKRKGKGKRMPDWYCKLFICSEMSEKELLDLINLHLHGIKQGIRTIRTGLMAGLSRPGENRDSRRSPSWITGASAGISRGG